MKHALLAIMFLLAPVSARAAGTNAEAQARTLSAVGVQQYDEGRYDEAIASFDAAYHLVPLPMLIFDGAQAYRMKGEAHCAEALSRYRSFLRAASPSDASRALAEEYVAKMSDCVRRRAAEPVPPIANKDTPVSAPVVPHEESHPRLALRISGIAALALGVSMVASGAYFGSAAAGRRSDIDAACRNGCTWNDALASMESERSSDVTKAIALSAVGGAALIAGAVVTYLGFRPERPRKRAWFVPQLAPGFASVGVGGTL